MLIMCVWALPWSDLGQAWQESTWAEGDPGSGEAPVEL